MPKVSRVAGYPDIAKPQLKEQLKASANMGRIVALVTRLRLVSFKPFTHPETKNPVSRMDIIKSAREKGKPDSKTYTVTRGSAIDCTLHLALDAGISPRLIERILQVVEDGLVPDKLAVYEINLNAKTLRGMQAGFLHSDISSAETRAALAVEIRSQTENKLFDERLKQMTLQDLEKRKLVKIYRYPEATTGVHTLGTVAEAAGVAIGTAFQLVLFGKGS